MMFLFFETQRDCCVGEVKNSRVLMPNLNGEEPQLAFLFGLIFLLKQSFSLFYELQFVILSF